MTSLAEALLAKAQAEQSRKYNGGLGPRETHDFRRIDCLPRYHWGDDPTLETYAQELTKYLKTPDGQWALRPLQAAALRDLYACNGAAGPLRVGAGKTLISFLAGIVLDSERVLLLIPAKLKKKTEREFKILAQHWKKPLHLKVMSYELLSRDRGVKELFEYIPDLIIADEAHKLKNTSATCTKRIRRYLRETRKTQHVSFLPMSGTFTKKSLRDFWHLVLWALGKNAPLPLDYMEMTRWANVLDVQKKKQEASHSGWMLCDPFHPGVLARWAENPEICSSVRQGFMRRFISSPGIVASVGNTSIDAPIILKQTSLTIPPEVECLFGDLRHTGQNSLGEVLVEKVALWRYARQLSCGFFYKWDPPPPEIWLMARKEWTAELRECLKLSRKYEAPLQVTQAIIRGEFGELSLKTYNNWKTVEPMYVPNTVPVHISDFVVDYAIAWANEAPGIIWTEHRHIGNRIAEKSGLPYYSNEGVDKKTGNIIDEATESCVASIASNCEGRNLQQFYRNLTISCPPGGPTWEQKLGRTHREGQEADEIECEVLLNCQEQWSSFENARNEALYSQDTTGHAHKLLIADNADSSGRKHQKGHAWDTRSEKYFNKA